MDKYLKARNEYVVMRGENLKKKKKNLNVRKNQNCFINLQMEN